MEESLQKQNLLLTLFLIKSHPPLDHFKYQTDSPGPRILCQVAFWKEIITDSLKKLPIIMKHSFSSI